MFITLHDEHGVPIAVNPLLIARIESDNDGYWLVQATDPSVVRIKESPDEVEKLAKELVRKTAKDTLDIAEMLADEVKKMLDV